MAELPLGREPIVVQGAQGLIFYATALADSGPPAAGAYTYPGNMLPPVASLAVRPARYEWRVCLN
jgi:hypothetical protein